jgi:hypothetical protein
MKIVLFLAITGGLIAAGAVTPGNPSEKYGPAAAMKFARHYRGEAFEPAEISCYPQAAGVPFSDTENIIPMTATLWTPAQLSADFQRRMDALPEQERKRGIIVLLKTERCAPKKLRACTVTTAALEKRSTPLAGHFLVYGVLLLPRDGDAPAGSLDIEKGGDAWKNEAAGTYDFKQGPGATLAFLHPDSGAVMEITNAVRLHLMERNFIRADGRTPELEAKLQEMLAKLRASSPASG